jgi:serine/threonine protein kinase
MIPSPTPARRSGNALPDGARLGEFEIRSVIGEGGFGIVYLAWDHLLQRQVAIKEYMPSTLATRSLAAPDVAPRADKFAETFALGLRSFVNEAQLLASFDHPSLLKVYRFWEANGTAYMVMPYYQGITLKRWLIERNAPPDEGWLLALLEPLLDALELMHRARCYHRDIAPDNVLLLGDGTPLLLDFGAARRVIGDATQALTAFLKPGYAPVEQYAEMPSMKQGAWTDLYALGSVVHYAVIGHTPPESVARLVNDTMVPLQRAAAGRYGERFLRAIDHALGVRPQDRPQSVAELRAELGLQLRRPGLQRKSSDLRTAPQAIDPLRPQARDPVPPQVRDSQAPLPAVDSPARQAGATRRAAGVWIGVALAASFGVGVGVWWLWRTDTGAPQAPSAVTAPNVTAPLGTPALPQTGAPDTAQRVEGAVISAPKAAPVESPLPDAAPAAAPNPPPPAVEPRAAATKARPAPRLNPPNARCTEIIARVSLGEPLSVAERTILQEECRQ